LASLDLPASFKLAKALPVPGLNGGSVAGNSMKFEAYGVLLLAL
jgi:hypothetical protein